MGEVSLENVSVNVDVDCHEQKVDRKRAGNMTSELSEFHTVERMTWPFVDCRATPSLLHPTNDIW